MTLLELTPETGRTHQLRVHLAAIGHPIAGDALYTMNDNDYLDWLHNPPSQTNLHRQAPAQPPPAIFPSRTANHLHPERTFGP